MSLNEKATLLYGDGNWKIHGAPSLGLPGIELHDGPFGLVKFKGDDDLNGHTPEPSICFPGPCALASSFNEELVEEVGRTVGRICRDAGTNMILAPGLNIKRNPLCGRNFEYYSEDPLVSGKMAAAYVNGVQSQGVGACIKHFACNSQESYRMVNNSIVDNRALHEIYLKGFEIAVKESHPWAVMSSYNKINGVYASDSDFLLWDELKGKWGFDGVVMSDWGGCNDYVYSHAHGLDVEMPCFHSRKGEIKRAVNNGSLPIAKVDDCANRVVRLLSRCSNKVRYERCFPEEAHNLAIEAALESVVLLKNDGVLPFKSFKQTSIIGELARNPNIQGGGSSRLTPFKVDSFYSTCVKELGEDNVNFAPGYSVDKNEDSSDLAVDAVDLAARGGKVILFMGLDPHEESEGYDREDLHLPEEQISLFNQIYEVNKNIIVVLNVGAPVELPFKDKAKAILLSYLPGEGGGEAIYRLLGGLACPCGHLAETWPTRAYDVPSFGFYPGTEMISLYRESIYVGYRYYLSAKKAVNYPFGFGLSYAKFKYSDLKISPKEIKPGQSVKVSVKVENVSSVYGKAVIQLYQEPPKGEVFKALRTLIGFTKVGLEPGESKKVEFMVNYDDFAHFDLESENYAVEGGVYQIQIGEDCQTIKASANLNVISDKVFKSLKNVANIYYNLPDDGFLPYDNDFEALIGHLIPVEVDRQNRPFDLNSTIGNISDTFIGKRLLKAAKARAIKPDDPNAKMIEKGILEMPLRNLGMAIPNRLIQVILDMANGLYLFAFWHLIFPKGRVHR